MASERLDDDAVGTILATLMEYVSMPLACKTVKSSVSHSAKTREITLTEGNLIEHASAVLILWAGLMLSKRETCVVFLIRCVVCYRVVSPS